MITAKFGGTSLCDAQQFRAVQRIIESDARRRFIVVSAPGKRSEDDVKITDLLIACYNAAREGGDVAAAFRPVRARFEEIIAQLSLSLDLSQEFTATVWAMESGVGSAFCLSRGEYFSARIMAALLGRPFVDPVHFVFFNGQGAFDPEIAEHSLGERLRELDCAVLPGFYGAMPDGTVHTFARGGSDISGAIVARASGSEIYENWTDVPGVLAADPRIVPNPRLVDVMTYDEVRELSYLGANVLHPDAILPAKRAGIPIHIRNTMDPDSPGTWIVEKTDRPGSLITSVAGRRGYSSIQVEKDTANAEVGYCRKILSCLEKHGISFEHLATGIGSTAVIVPTQEVRASAEALKRSIESTVHPDSLEITDGLAMITVVGREMVGKAKAAVRLFDAISGAGIPVRLIDQGTRELNIVVGVDEQYFSAGMNAVYQAFFGEEA
ncbi:MAG: aspartate kinase [Firmicutes bacterium]|nr:aspartate kinase [Bacillota bacterium]